MHSDSLSPSAGGQAVGVDGRARARAHGGDAPAHTNPPLVALRGRARSFSCVDHVGNGGRGDNAADIVEVEVDAVGTGCSNGGLHLRPGPSAAAVCGVSVHCGVKAEGTEQLRFSTRGCNAYNARAS